MGRVLKRVCRVPRGNLMDAQGAPLGTCRRCRPPWPGGEFANAALDELGDRACALGFVVSEATPHVMPFLVELAGDHTVRNRADVLAPLARIHSARQWESAAAARREGTRRRTRGRPAGRPRAGTLLRRVPGCSGDWWKIRIPVWPGRRATWSRLSRSRPPASWSAWTAGAPSGPPSRPAKARRALTRRRPCGLDYASAVSTGCPLPRTKSAGTRPAARDPTGAGAAGSPFTSAPTPYAARAAS